MLWKIGEIGCASRVEGDILEFVDRAYFAHKKYGETADRDNDAAPRLPEEQERAGDSSDGRVFGFEVDEISPVYTCLLAVERDRRKSKPGLLSSWTYNAAIFCRGLERALRRTMVGGSIFPYYKAY